MTKEQVLAEVLKHHDPKLREIEGSMVSEVWEDGEHTSTKCGSIFRCRGLHTMTPGFQRDERVKEFFKQNFPNKEGQHTSIFAPYDVADRLSALVSEATYE
jgi:hypothetical protein